MDLAHTHTHTHMTHGYLFWPPACWCAWKSLKRFENADQTDFSEEYLRKLNLHPSRRGKGVLGMLEFQNTWWFLADVFSGKTYAFFGIAFLDPTKTPRGWAGCISKLGRPWNITCLNTGHKLTTSHHLPPYIWCKNQLETRGFERNYLLVPFDHEVWLLLARLEAIYSQSGAKSFSSTSLRRIYEPLCGEKLQKHVPRLVCFCCFRW